jgi:hypothetical protein
MEAQVAPSPGPTARRSARAWLEPELSFLDLEPLTAGEGPRTSDDTPDNGHGEPASDHQG